jgi:thiocyanate desulfurase
MRNRNVNRRSLLKMAAAGVAGAGMFKGLEYLGATPTWGASTAATRKFTGIREDLGDYIYLTPTKLGGATQAVDLMSMKQLAWIAYWNYGDTCPISHHLAAFPADTGDPRKGFEFVNTTQGGDNVLMYGIPTQIKDLGLLDKINGQGNQIYRVGYEGNTGQMELYENIAETTGLGLGVHTVIFPDGEGFACADGQKDIVGFFNRARGPQEKTKVLAAFRADWKPNSEFLGETWLKGGTIRLERLTPSVELSGGRHSPDGYYDYRGSTGNKLNYEMAPMAELLVERGQIPGASPHTLTGLDFALHDPRNQFTAMGLRMCGGCIIMDRKNWEPRCFLQANKGCEANVPVKKVSGTPEIWEIVLPKVENPIHESGFNPSRNPPIFTIMNNLRANNMAIFDVKDPDPRNWQRVNYVHDPSWVGEYPSPFHVAFSIDGSKMFVSILRPKPARSDVVVVDTKTWKIIKTFSNVGVDCQTMAVTYDGKYVIQIFSGFQRLEAGAFVFRQDTLEEVGYMPNFGGHHDCVIVPRTVEELKFSRCCAV